MMENHELIKLWERACNLAKRKGFSQCADDFAQEVAIKAFTSGFINLEWCFVDYLRKEYGRTGTPGGNARSIAMRTSKSLDAPQHGDDGLSLHECIGGNEPEPGCFGADWRSFVGIRGGRRKDLIYELVFDCGFTAVEAGAMLGISESRVSQLMRPIKAEIQRAAIRAEVLAEYHDDPEYSKLAIQWITL